MARKVFTAAWTLSALSLYIAPGAAQGPADSESWKFTVDPACNKAQLQVEGPGNTSTSCQAISFQPGPAAEHFRVTAVDKQVRVEAGEAPPLAMHEVLCLQYNGGPKGLPDRASLDPNTFVFQATADRVTRNGAGGTTLTLEGRAHLLSSGGGRFADIGAERISVNLLTGRVEIAEKVAPPPRYTFTVLPELLPNINRVAGGLAGMQQGFSPGGR